jgi:hypothetical protein
MFKLLFLNINPALFKKVPQNTTFKKGWTKLCTKFITEGLVQPFPKVVQRLLS